MRIANVAGRLGVITGDGYVDVQQASKQQASKGRFGPDPQAVFDRWDEFTRWAGAADLSEVQPLTLSELGAPAPRPRQSFAIGLNYQDHADESGFTKPAIDLPVFTKYVSSITGPHTEVTIPAEGNVDWEVELVAVLGRAAHNVSARHGWDYVAGLTVGQDISERRLQMAAAAPQFSLAKSLPGFSPMGPCLVTPDELAEPDNLELGCLIDGEQMQHGRTKDLIYSVPELIAYLSAILPLSPGDVIFTGTPSGVGLGRTPQRWLAEGEELVSYVEGIGEMRQMFRVAAGQSGTK